MARKDLLALYIVITSMAIMRHATASEFLNCAETPFKLSGVCDGNAYKQTSHALEEAIVSLKVSSNADLSYLSVMDEQALARSLESCANPSACLPPFTSVAACVTTNLRLASAYITDSSGKEMLLAYLQKSRYLDAAVVKKFPRQFIGITARYFGRLHLAGSKFDQALQGNLTDIDHTTSFPAQLLNPSAQEAAFFENGPCKQYCTSSWLGSFVLVQNTPTFQLSSQWK